MKEKYAVFDLGQMVNIPGRTPIGLVIIFRPEALFKVGVLREILETISSEGFSILYFALSQPKPLTPLTSFFVIDATEKLKDVQKLAKKIKKCGDVAKVEVIEPLFDSLLINTYFDALYVAGERSVIFRKTLYQALIKIVREFFGTGGGALLYHMGTVIGRQAFESHKEIAGEYLDRLIKISEALFKAFGFGKAEILEVDVKNGKARVRVWNSFECELFKQAGEPSSHFVRGIWSGWFQALFKREVRSVEVKCIAKGDEYCEFRIF